MNLRRIRWTLTGWYVAALLAILLIVSGGIYLWLSHVLRSEVDSSLRDGANKLASQVTEEFVESSRLSLTGRGNSIGQELSYLNGAGGDIFYVVFSPQGAPLANPLNIDLASLADTRVLQDSSSNGAVWRTVRLSGGQYRLLYLPVHQADQTIAVVAAGRSLREKNSELRSLLAVLMISSAGGLVLALLGGFYLAGRALAPTKRAFDQQHRFIADASHELRSPLTLIKASAEAIQRSAAPRLQAPDREALSDIVNETDRMSGLVNDLLLLARLDEGQLQQSHDLIDVGETVREAVRLQRGSIGNRQIEFAVAVSPGALPTKGSEAEITRVLRILLDNAVRHTPDGGRIDVRAEIVDGQIRVSVSDTGPGVPSEDLEAIFDRFYRVDQARSRESGGYGLGLAIARGVVEAHGGRIWASNSEASGTTFYVTLPLAAR